MCFTWISEQTAIISLYSINLSGFFYNRCSECLLRGSNWIFNSISYSFVLKSLTKFATSTCHSSSFRHNVTCLQICANSLNSEALTAVIINFVPQSLGIKLYSISVSVAEYSNAEDPESRQYL